MGFGKNRIYFGDEGRERDAAARKLSEMAEKVPLRGRRGTF